MHIIKNLSIFVIHVLLLFLTYFSKLFSSKSFVSINECKLSNTLNDEFYFHNRIISITSQIFVISAQCIYLTVCKHVGLYRFPCS